MTDASKLEFCKFMALGRDRSKNKTGPVPEKTRICGT